MSAKKKSKRSTKKGSKKKKKQAENQETPAPVHHGEPPYSCKVMWVKGCIRVKVNLNRIPPKCINFEPTPTQFYLDTYKYSKKFLLQFPYPGNCTVDSKDAEATFEYGYLSTDLPITGWGDYESKHTEISMKYPKREPSGQMPHAGKKRKRKALEEDEDEELRKKLEKKAKRAARKEKSRRLKAEAAMAQMFNNQGNSDREENVFRGIDQADMSDDDVNAGISNNAHCRVPLTGRGKKRFVPKDDALAIIDQVSAQWDQRRDRIAAREEKTALKIEQAEAKARKRKALREKEKRQRAKVTEQLLREEKRSRRQKRRDAIEEAELEKEEQELRQKLRQTNSISKAKKWIKEAVLKKEKLRNGKRDVNDTGIDYYEGKPQSKNALRRAKAKRRKAKKKRETFE